MPQLTTITFDIWEVILICVVVAFVVYGLTKIFLSWKFKKESARKRAYWESNRTEEHCVVNFPKDKAVQRLEDMCDGTITIKKLMNNEEARIYYALAKVFKENYNISPQVSFKAFLKGEQDTNAWRSFSDFYCDFLVTHKRGEHKDKPVAVIEYHGGKHYGTDNELEAKVRKNDLVKAQVLGKVGIASLIIRESDIKGDSQYIDDIMLEKCVTELYSLI